MYRELQKTPYPNGVIAAIGAFDILVAFWQ